MCGHGRCWRCLRLKSATETGEPPDVTTMWKRSALHVSSSGTTRSLGSTSCARCGLYKACM
eukprot:4104006-Pleurochrysis_carterae.AAC.1